MVDLVDRAKLEELSESFNELWAMHKAQKATIATLIRVSVHRIENAKGKRGPYREGIDSLTRLADMLDKQNDSANE